MIFAGVFFTCVEVPADDGPNLAMGDLYIIIRTILIVRTMSGMSPNAGLLTEIPIEFCNVMQNFVVEKVLLILPPAINVATFVVLAKIFSWAWKAFYLMKFLTVIICSPEWSSM